jgi:hypothetical protein
MGGLEKLKALAFARALKKSSIYESAKKTTR